MKSVIRFVLTNKQKQRATFACRLALNLAAWRLAASPARTEAAWDRRANSASAAQCSDMWRTWRSKIFVTSKKNHQFTLRKYTYFGNFIESYWSLGWLVTFGSGYFRGFSVGCSHRHICRIALKIKRINSNIRWDCIEFIEISLTKLVLASTEKFSSSAFGSTSWNRKSSWKFCRGIQSDFGKTFTMYAGGLLHWSLQGGQKQSPNKYNVNMEVLTYVLKNGFSKSSLW